MTGTLSSANLQTQTGTAVPDVDFYLFINLQGSGCSTTSGTVGYAGACVKDQCDRPLFGTMTLCTQTSLGYASVATSKQVNAIVDTGVHELLHALYFSSSFFPYFKDVNGTALMDPSDISWYTCTAPSGPVSWNTAAAPIGTDIWYHKLFDAANGGILNTATHAGFATGDCKCPTTILSNAAAGSYTNADLLTCLVSSQQVPSCIIQVGCWAVYGQPNNLGNRFCQIDHVVGHRSISQAFFRARPVFHPLSDGESQSA